MHGREEDDDVTTDEDASISVTARPDVHVQRKQIINTDAAVSLLIIISLQTNNQLHSQEESLPPLASVSYF